MATSRVDLKAKIFAEITGNSAIMSLLGDVIDKNRRVYSGWPQEQPVLSDVEPEEGWLTFHSPITYKPFNGSLWEDHIIQFDVWSKLESINIKVIELLDGMYDKPPVDQAGDIITDDWVILLSQRISSQELYDENVKLYHHIATYTFRTLKIPSRLGA